MKKLSILLPFLSFVFWMFMALPYVNAQENEGMTLLGRWTDGPVTTVYVDGQMAYYNMGSKLAILDIKKPSDPILLKEFETVGTVRDMQRVGDLLYTIMDENGLVIYNLKDINNPQMAGSLPLYCYDGELVVRGSFAFVSDGFQRMFIIDVSNPAKPAEMNKFLLGFKPDQMILNHEIIYLAGGFSGLMGIDVANPKIPKVVHNYVCDYVGDLTLLDDQMLAFLSSDTLHLLDIKNPEDCKLYKSIGGFGEITHVAVDKGTLFASGVHGNLQTYALDAQYNVTPLGTTPAQVEDPVYELTVADNVAFQAKGGEGLTLIDVTNLSNPAVITTFAAKGNSEGIAIRDQIAFVAQMKSGVQILDVSNPQAIKPISTIPAYDEVSKVAIDGNLLYVADGDADFHIYDVSNLMQPKELGSLDLPDGTADFLVKDGMAYIAQQSRGVYIAEVKNPQNVKLIGNYDTRTKVAGIDQVDHYLYLANGDAGMIVLDINKPGNPKMAGLYTDTRNVRDVVINDHYAYLADYTNGMHVIDIANPTDPVEAGSLFILGKSERILHFNHFVIVALDYRGLAVMDVQNPASPKLVGYYNTPGSVRDVQINDGKIYVADHDGGIAVFRIDVTGGMTY